MYKLKSPFISPDPSPQIVITASVMCIFTALFLVLNVNGLLWYMLLGNFFFKLKLVS